MNWGGGARHVVQWSLGLRAKLQRRISSLTCRTTAAKTRGRTWRMPALAPIAAGPCTWHAASRVAKALVSRKATYMRLPATG